MLKNTVLIDASFNELTDEEASKRLEQGQAVFVVHPDMLAYMKGEQSYDNNG
jgi:hypothetical protein